jgi:hypothetical protein
VPPKKKIEAYQEKLANSDKEFKFEEQPNN